jgi:hypothetical protein
MYITVQFLVILPFILLVKYGMGRKAVLSVSEKKEVLAHRDQFPATSQQNIANLGMNPSVVVELVIYLVRKINGKI